MGEKTGHAQLGIGTIHYPHNWKFADATARVVATDPNSALPYSVLDIDKFALQSSDNTYWRLATTTPTWTAVGGGSVATDGTTINASGSGSSLQIIDGGVTTAKLATGAVTAAKASTGAGSTNLCIGNDARLSDNARASNNLSDLADASTARDNLGLGAGADVTFNSIAGGTITGTGSGISALAAANIVPGGALPQLDGSALTNVIAVNIVGGGTLPQLDASALTNITAANLTGPLPGAFADGTYTTGFGNVLNGTITIVNGVVTNIVSPQN